MRVMFMAMFVVVPMSVCRTVFRVHRVVVATILRVAFGHVMVVEMEEALNKKHGQEATQQPAHHAIDGMQLLIGIGHKMQEGNSQHQPSNKTDGDLQARDGQRIFRADVDVSRVCSMTDEMAGWFIIVQQLPSPAI